MSKTLNNDNDAEQYRLLKVGDRQAFDALFRKYFFSLVAFAGQWVSAEDAKDVVQEIFLWIWENRRELSINTKFSSYLYTAVKNRCLNLIARGKVAEVVKSDIVRSLSEDIYYERENFAELWQSLSRELVRLPDSYRDVFVMHRINGLSYKEIAELKQVSVKTIDYRMCNALKKLREKLKELR